LDEAEKTAHASDGSFIGWQTVFAFFRQIWVGPLRLNIFLKPDPAEAMHDHAWDFVSFPLHAYVEEYLDGDTIKKQVIPRFKLNRQKAEHTHRYMGKWLGTGMVTTPGTVVTLCWTGPAKRKWNFVRVHKGKARRFPWKPYIRRIINTPHMEAAMSDDNWPDPTPEMLDTPEFIAIWDCIKTWDINVPDAYEGYCGATGNHVRAILEALANRPRKLMPNPALPKTLDF
jgi:hypothetical protein